jgi:hypothetical protein
VGAIQDAVSLIGGIHGSVGSKNTDVLVTGSLYLVGGLGSYPGAATYNRQWRQLPFKFIYNMLLRSSLLLPSFLKRAYHVEVGYLRGWTG